MAPHVPRPCARATAAPLSPQPSNAGTEGAATGDAAFSWPAEFEGRPLRELPLTGRDRRFADDFPGRIGRFTDGSRELIVRFTTRATRRLHPASDCLKAIGYAIDPLPARRGADGSTWGCFAARRQQDTLAVCEQIRDAEGRTWPDPSSWYWSALAGSSRGPWWSTTIVDRRDESDHEFSGDAQVPSAATRGRAASSGEFLQEDPQLPTHFGGTFHFQPSKTSSVAGQ